MGVQEKKVNTCILCQGEVNAKINNNHDIMMNNHNTVIRKINGVWDAIIIMRNDIIQGTKAQSNSLFKISSAAFIGGIIGVTVRITLSGEAKLFLNYLSKLI